MSGLESQCPNCGKFVAPDEEFADRLDTAERWAFTAREYIALLTDELTELIGFASTHGWRSSRYERGKELRAALGITGAGEESAPAEEPREAVKPAPAPARLSPLPLQREPDWWCCGADYDEHDPTCRNYKGGPAPATAQRWRCEGCGWVGGDAWDHQGAMVHGYGGEDICGPCRSVVPVGEVGS